jgi:hypothetical protein
MPNWLEVQGLRYYLRAWFVLLFRNQEAAINCKTGSARPGERCRSPRFSSAIHQVSRPKFLPRATQSALAETLGNWVLRKHHLRWPKTHDLIAD